MSDPSLDTGVSSGIGVIYADRLARRGYDLFGLARKPAALRRDFNFLWLEPGARPPP